MLHNIAYYQILYYPPKQKSCWPKLLVGGFLALRLNLFELCFRENRGSDQPYFKESVKINHFEAKVKGIYRPRSTCH